MRLTDPLGRVATDLRVSLTDRCNLRCRYCLPAAGIPPLPNVALLTGPEVVRLVGVAVGLGVQRVRFTGGEPLLRRDLGEIVAAIATEHPGLELALTTNGIGLDRQAERLRAAGLRRVNISLDTLDPFQFRVLARRPGLDRVLAGIEVARETFDAGAVRVNAVLLREVNLDQAVPLLGWCLERGLELRFIEQMPLDAAGVWRRDQMVTTAETRTLLADRFELRPVPEPRTSAPAERYLVRDRWVAGQQPPGRVGFIAAVTQPFCRSCSRTRLTADGQVRSCLFGNAETDLRGALRAGACDQELAAIWRAAHEHKPVGHALATADVAPPMRPMSRIGG